MSKTQHLMFNVQCLISEALLQYLRPGNVEHYWILVILTLNRIGT